MNGIKFRKRKVVLFMLVIIMVNQLFAIQKIYAVEKNDVKVAYREFLSEKICFGQIDIRQMRE